MKTSNFLSFGKSDAIKAILMFIIATVLSVAGDAVMQAITNGDYSLDSIHWKSIAGAIGVATISYIQKNVLTNSEDKFLKKEPTNEG